MKNGPDNRIATGYPVHPYNASYYMCRKITSHWQPLFSKKMVAAASFSYKIGGGGLIFLQNWRRRPHFPTKLAAAASFSNKIGDGGKDLATLLAAVLTWSGYWIVTACSHLRQQRNMAANFSNLECSLRGFWCTSLPVNEIPGSIESRDVPDSDFAG